MEVKQIGFDYLNKKIYFKFQNSKIFKIKIDKNDYFLFIKRIK